MTRSNTELNLELPGYEIIREVGRGGVSTVYLARHELMDREVAIKVMSPVLAVEEGFNRRFMREGQTVAQLKHPGIVTVYDVTVVHYRPFIAMEYLPGGSLKDRMKKPLPPKQAITYLGTIADSLGYAHSRGIFHRDVKPENILFRENGDAVLTDFGIAKTDTHDTALTSIGVVVGTPRYISPEQAQGYGSDARSDIYALGVMLHEMLTGHPPYDVKGSMSLLYAHINEPIPQLPRQYVHFQDLLDDLLAKDPEKRISDCSVLVERLNEAATGRRSRRRFRRRSGSRRSPSRAGRMKWPAAVLAGLALPVVGLVLWSEGFRLGAGPRPVDESFKSMVSDLVETGEEPSTPSAQTAPEAAATPASVPPLPHRGETLPPASIAERQPVANDPQEVEPEPVTVARSEPAVGTGPETQWKLVSEQDAESQAILSSDIVGVSSELDAQSLYNQAQAVLSGRIAEANLAVAARLHEQAAVKGHPRSQYYLGVAYGNGDGVERDEALARRWLDRAAEAGVQGARYNLVLADVFGDDRDPRAAAASALELAEQKYSPSYRILGWMYNTGTGVESSFAQSVRWSVKKMMGDVTGANSPRWVVRRWERQLETELSKIEIKPSQIKPALK